MQLRALTPSVRGERFLCRFSGSQTCTRPDKLLAAALFFLPPLLSPHPSTHHPPHGSNHTHSPLAAALIYLFCPLFLSCTCKEIRDVPQDGSFSRGEWRVCVPRTVNTIHRRGLIKSRLQRGRDAAPSSRPKKKLRKDSSNNSGRLRRILLTVSAGECKM